MDKICKNCGYPSPMQNNFCQYCGGTEFVMADGTPVQTQNQQAQYQQEQYQQEQYQQAQYQQEQYQQAQYQQEQYQQAQYQQAQYQQAQYQQAQYQQPPVPAQQKGKKNKGMIIGIVAAVLIVLAAIGFGAEKAFQKTGDGNQDNSTVTTTAPSVVSEEDTTATQAEETPVETTAAVQNSASETMATDLKLDKIGSIDKKYIYCSYGSAFSYEDYDTEKYGIITFDGKSDTGAIYTTCKEIGNYFQVTTADPATIIDAASLNCVGIVDATGKEIIPMEYASFSEINDRFLRCCKVTEQTTNKDEALVYYTDDIFSLTASDDDILFKGVWYIFDLAAGQFIEGISATNSYSIYEYGNIIEYVNDADEQIAINAKGEVIPKDADIYDNSTYSLDGTVYDENGNKIFSFDENGFDPYTADGEYYFASCYKDGTTKYAIMDSTGKIISAEFDKSPSIEGSLLEVDNKLCKFDGTVVFDATPASDNIYPSINYESTFGGAYFIKNDKTYTLIEANGTVLYQGTEDDTYSFDPYTNFTISKKTDDSQLYYSVADKDFTIKGSVIGPWLFEVGNSSDNYDLLDSLTGKTILKDYYDYDFIKNSGNYYLIAEKVEGGYDVYSVK